MDTFDWQTSVTVVPSICPIVIGPQSVHAIPSFQQISVCEERGRVSV